MAPRRQQTLRSRRDELQAAIATARTAQHELQRSRQEANEPVETAKQAYVAAMAEARDPTGASSQAAAKQLEQAQAKAYRGVWDEKVAAAERIVLERQGDLERFLREQGADLIRELTAEAQAIPEDWAGLVE